MLPAQRNRAHTRTIRFLSILNISVTCKVSLSQTRTTFRFQACKEGCHFICLKDKASICVDIYSKEQIFYRAKQLETFSCQFCLLIQLVFFLSETTQPFLVWGVAEQGSQPTCADVPNLRNQKYPTKQREKLCVPVSDLKNKFFTQLSKRFQPFYTNGNLTETLTCFNCFLSEETLPSYCINKDTRETSPFAFHEKNKNIGLKACCFTTAEFLHQLGSYPPAKLSTKTWGHLIRGYENTVILVWPHTRKSRQKFWGLILCVIFGGGFCWECDKLLCPDS